MEILVFEIVAWPWHAFLRIDVWNSFTIPFHDVILNSLLSCITEEGTLMSIWLSWLEQWKMMTELFFLKEVAFSQPLLECGIHLWHPMSWGLCAMILNILWLLWQLMRLTLLIIRFLTLDESFLLENRLTLRAMYVCNFTFLALYVLIWNWEILVSFAYSYAFFGLFCAGLSLGPF